jgi:hypothetical protein
MFVIDNCFRNRLQAPENQVLNLLVALVDFLGAISRHQVQLHSSEVPLASKFLIVVVGGFLDGHIRQMHESVR